MCVLRASCPGHRDNKLARIVLRVAKKGGHPFPLARYPPKGYVLSEEIYGVPYISGLAGPLGNDGCQAFGVRFITGARNYRCAGRGTRT